jgi:hypothetical protein
MPPTAEERARTYSAAMDSVNLINREAPVESTPQDWKDSLQRNVDHLEIMISKTWWEEENLQPLIDAIATGKTKINSL